MNEQTRREFLKTAGAAAVLTAANPTALLAKQSAEPPLYVIGGAPNSPSYRVQISFDYAGEASDFLKDRCGRRVPLSCTLLLQDVWPRTQEKPNYSVRIIAFDDARKAFWGLNDLVVPHAGWKLTGEEREYVSCARDFIIEYYDGDVGSWRQTGPWQFEPIEAEPAVT